MRIDGKAALALFICGSAACATASKDSEGRKDSSHIKVTASPPLLPNQVITDFTFSVKDGHISMESPGNPSAFDLTEESDGCVRGNVNKAGNLQEICRMPAADGDPPGLSRWKSATSTLVFTVRLNPDQSRILVDAGRSHGEFVLGTSAAADELRKRPELLGAAFAYGYVPQANATPDGPMLNSTFVVSSAN
jgi:hypothetical protein